MTKTINAAAAADITVLRFHNATVVMDDGSERERAAVVLVFVPTHRANVAIEGGSVTLERVQVGRDDAEPEFAEGVTVIGEYVGSKVTNRVPLWLAQETFGADDVAEQDEPLAFDMAEASWEMARSLGHDPGAKPAQVTLNDETRFAKVRRRVYSGRIGILEREDGKLKLAVFTKVPLLLRADLIESEEQPTEGNLSITRIMSNGEFVPDKVVKMDYTVQPIPTAQPGVVAYRSGSGVLLLAGEVTVEDGFDWLPADVAESLNLAPTEFGTIEDAIQHELDTMPEGEDRDLLVAELERAREAIRASEQA